jgi:putative ABC transport system permease protein
MKWSDGLRIAFFSLIENPLRTFLTLLGIAIGVTAVILVISVIQGLNLYVADTVSDLGPQVFVVDRFGIIKGRENFLRAARRNKELTMEDADAFRRQATLAEEVAVTQDAGASVKRGRNVVTDVRIHAVSPEGLDVEPFDVAAGRVFTPSEIRRAGHVAFIGSEIADKLFPRIDAVGRKITVWGRGFTVTGVAEKRGSVFGQSRDTFVMVPLTTFRKIRGSHGSINISVKARDVRRVPEAMDEIGAILRVRHHLRYNEEDDFGFISAKSLMQFWEDLTQMIFRVAVFVVSISLVVGGIVIMNIMLLTVVERTREIGVRKAVGARQRDVRFQFLVESIMLCAAGGAIGVSIGWLCAWAVRTYSPIPARFPIWAPILAVAITSAVGIFFGLHPARKAAKMDPIEALRTEET